MIKNCNFTILAHALCKNNKTIQESYRILKEFKLPTKTSMRTAIQWLGLKIAGKMSGM
jgi:hypothetical protein